MKYFFAVSPIFALLVGCSHLANNSHLDSFFIEQKIAMLEEDAKKMKCPKWVIPPKWVEDATSQGFKVIDENKSYKNVFYFIPLEGDYYAFVDYAAVKNSLGNKLPEDWQEYLDIMDLETVHRLLQDGAIICSFSELKDRILRIVRFVYRYPNFVRTPQLKEKLANYVRAFTQGTDNTKIKDHVNETMDSYEAFLRNCSDCPERDSVLLAHEIWKKSQTFSREQAAQDLTFLVARIAQNHLSAINGLPKEVKTQFEKEIAALPQNVSRAQLWASALRIVARLKDGHSYILVHKCSDDYEFRIQYHIIEDDCIWIFLNGKKYNVVRINGVEVKIDDGLGSFLIY
jgi:hypothetical protein